ncbi:phosphatidylserine decarboxylase [Roseivirga spongicola]|uniref:Phosphatidylserine decarboxylase proenzyme n=1 Tax=Roseivirga spongicola TaxID=333140 RepID=A0A150XF99_9BACT|nr:MULTISPECIES: phosphatidylserine decarboxylase family protein [Roseivirga]KYG77356.1 phosphatidylserine decarboxylase [Roseivirga spongicola]MBO6662555.1 phosphatidylserine decarboxylase family protein [Roseivirga sp.]MBO6760163.1 phosphatidylserine decarboxylase family protein [Roseivirga sp.]MBO6909562.1 phosphatidylserine decarboxylase family protein [Roseivirga sp.]
MKVHHEGRGFLTILFFVLIVLNAGIIYLAPIPELIKYIVGGVSLAVFLFFLQFFRNPTRKIELNEKYVLAPADGKVVVIETTTEDEYFKGKERIQVSIFMSPVNVHVNRNPVTGLIKYFKYHPGKYLVAWHPKSSTENERTTIVYQLHKNVEILIRQVAGAAARRIKWYIEEGNSVIQGREFGFIKFGSRVDLFLPLDAEVKVTNGQITKGGQTVIAELK